MATRWSGVPTGMRMPTRQTSAPGRQKTKTFNSVSYQRISLTHGRISRVIRMAYTQESVFGVFVYSVSTLTTRMNVNGATMKELFQNPLRIPTLQLAMEYKKELLALESLVEAKAEDQPYDEMAMVKHKRNVARILEVFKK